MAALEEKFFESHIKKSWLCWRFIDGIFLIWDRSENELKQFIEKLNEFHPTRKFTCGYSRERVHFLDVQVVLEKNKISTDLHVKETDIYQYLHPSSCHPCHCVKSILNSLTTQPNMFE